MLLTTEGQIKNIAPITTIPQTHARSDIATLLHEAPFFMVLLTFYGLGLLMSLTPCVLPMLPILLGIILGNRAILTPRKAFLLSSTYVFSMCLTYTAAGILAVELGSTLQTWFQRTEILSLFAALFVYLACTQMGWVHLGIPGRWSTWLHSFHHKQNSGAYLGAFVMGIIGTLIAAPCITAPLVGTLTYIAQTQDRILGGSALFMLGLGMGTLLIIAGTLEIKYLPKRGPWMHWINLGFATLFLGFAIWLLERFWYGPITLGLWALLCIFLAIQLKCFHWKVAGLAPRLGTALFCAGLLLGHAALNGHAHPWSAFTPSPSDSTHPSDVQNTVTNLKEWTAAQTKAKEKKQVIILKVTADWCIACRHMETSIFSSVDIQNSLKPFHQIILDITHSTPENRALLKKLSILGPPTLLFFDKYGQELKNARITGEIGKAPFIAHIKQIDSNLNNQR